MSVPRPAASPFDDGMFVATTRHVNLRAQAHLTDIDALVTRVLKISGSQDALTRAAKGFASKESQITSTALALKSIGNSVARLDAQATRLTEETKKVSELTQSVRGAASKQATDESTVTL
mmetsp:Transcript_4516/g.11538  ORF Transcript_4516/g.11538 Transcript_4516/m.11538 type:complete len:120 (+) Transcript_4516:23-382(+)|eukprot:CAMPEP_0182924862 /NCGR_PEP_ID=MMETSP0105_2-20130417/7785_1 /TAXON_ID=81532 ORGANISM="Acanthoeca-like sp., Strain 10tr" /NCGR_SAMPLE_ID=MMETSP0105_2 /ASSEMBLY_ACC=CAM_ASM_000205 /LENGTH=119 /DNA_ID=CAMNT_0025062681 /DNA_START=225 /DNA_END=584 /DNA_ORIENTATION=-